jgi:hypothetical protein
LAIQVRTAAPTLPGNSRQQGFGLIPPWHQRRSEDDARDWSEDSLNTAPDRTRRGRSERGSPHDDVEYDDRLAAGRWYVGWAAGLF